MLGSRSPSRTECSLTNWCDLLNCENQRAVFFGSQRSLVLLMLMGYLPEQRARSGSGRSQ